MDPTDDSQLEDYKGDVEMDLMDDSQSGCKADVKMDPVDDGQLGYKGDMKLGPVDDGQSGYSADMKMDPDIQLEGYKEDIKKPHLSVVERYYTKRYKTDLNDVIGEDFCILEHSNRICLVTLAPSHPIISQSLKVINCDFKVDEKNNRLNNKVSGKHKRGAQMIKQRSPLCHLTCDDDNVYTVYGCIHGSLVEVNEALVQNPQLITEKTYSTGYIAVILTWQNDHKKEMSKLLTEEQYNEALIKRKETFKNTVTKEKKEVTGMKTKLTDATSLDSELSKATGNETKLSEAVCMEIKLTEAANNETKVTEATSNETKLTEATGMDTKLTEAISMETALDKCSTTSTADETETDETLPMAHPDALSKTEASGMDTKLTEAIIMETELDKCRTVVH